MGSPLIPIDAVDLSTSQEPLCQQSLFLASDEFVDGNGPPEGKEEDQFQLEDAVSAAAHSQTDKLND